MAKKLGAKQERTTQAVCKLLAACTAIFGVSSFVAAQEVAAPLPATYTNPPLFWMPDAGSGWIDFDPDGDHIIIPVMLNGQPAKAMVDTGFDYLVVSKSYADAHHLPLTPWGKPLSVGGPTQYYTTSSVSIDVGAFRTVKPGAVTVIDLSKLAVLDLKDVDVVIGLPLLGPFEWQVDQDHHRFRLMKSGKVPLKNGTPIRVGPNNSRLVTDISINGKSVSPAMIDTGADDQVSLSVNTVEVTGFKPQTDKASVGAGGTMIQPFGRLTDFKIGQQKITGAYATIDASNWWGAGIQALVGMGTLRAYNMTVDLTAGQMTLEPRIRPVAPIHKSRDGIQGFVRDGRWAVAHVMRNSPAMTVGLRTGAEICGIDDKPVSQELLNGYWSRAATGTRHILKLCDGTSRIITLRLFY
ncbi:aspartyl protease family protein [Sphingomonas sanguinis]|uniref:Aspartyl protease family protein n=2 Tax=Sphingomonas sanguinis TaxID=33051 RepID=A0ABU5LU74_9SPHN|nr:aspartyl protease family protein [Sphingomonas sanguinis]MDZ7283467.1 aspartyl protease family protein [Sphingomonas sanguinis]